jgi:hypothetical protein
MSRIITGIVSAVCVSGAVLIAAPMAHADSPSEYIGRVQEALPTIYQRYGSSALLAEGNKICSMEAAGYEAYDEIKAVQRDLPMSDGSATHLIAIASVWMGC